MGLATGASLDALSFCAALASPAWSESSLPQRGVSPSVIVINSFLISLARAPWLRHSRWLLPWTLRFTAEFYASHPSSGRVFSLPLLSPLGACVSFKRVSLSREQEPSNTRQRCKLNETAPHVLIFMRLPCHRPPQSCPAPRQDPTTRSPTSPSQRSGLKRRPFSPHTCSRSS